MATQTPRGGITPSAVALGNFDGVHIGHRAIIDAARREASAIGGRTLAWTFRGRTKSGNTPLLTTPEYKCILLCEAGCDEVVCADFNEYRHYPPERFVREVLIEGLNCRVAVCGFNYRFGKNGAGDASLLSALMEECGGRALMLPPVTVMLCGESNDDGKCREVVVSSSMIRAALADGRPRDAAAMLGRPYSVRLPVEHGRRLGRLIGFPTINQCFPDGMIEPRRGVYVCSCAINGTVYRGVTNIGVRPTVETGDVVTMETHLFGFDGDLYGIEVEVSLLYFIRPEIRFDSVEELRRAIARDAQFAAAYQPYNP
jgi:riboflavin kinase/FMN adenylyltransferase